MQFRRYSPAEVPFFARGLRGWGALAAVAAVAVAMGFCSSAHAQDKEKPKIPKAEDLVLQTGDGLLLAMTYYPGLHGQAVDSHCVVARLETEPGRLQGSCLRPSKIRLRGDRARSARPRRQQAAERRHQG